MARSAVTLAACPPDRDNYRCYVDGCDRKATDADHIVPVSRGGAEYDPDNCRAACEHHNRSRGARPN
jgi:5-methylcytosine-specific restriction endonuclease McrA